MSNILKDYINLVESNKNILPTEVYEMIINTVKLPIKNLVPDKKDKEKYFIDGYEDLSQAVFNFLYSGKGRYIINYAHEYSVNRLSAGFNKIEELVHFSIWVIQEYYTNRQSSLDFYNELANKDKVLTEQQILDKVLASNHLKKEIEDLTINMRDHNDFIKRNALIKRREEYETFTESILSAQIFYKYLNKIYTSLNSINNVYELNKVPEPVKQSSFETSRVN